MHHGVVFFFLHRLHWPFKQKSSHVSVMKTSSFPKIKPSAGITKRQRRASITPHPGRVSNWRMNFLPGCFDVELICDCEPNSCTASWKVPGALVLETAAVGFNERYLLSLPHHGPPRVVDGGQFRLRVLGEKQRLLAPPERGGGLSAQGSRGRTGCKVKRDTEQNTQSGEAGCVARELPSSFSVCFSSSCTVDNAGAGWGGGGGTKETTGQRFESSRVIPYGH